MLKFLRSLVSTPQQLDERVLSQGLPATAAPSHLSAQGSSDFAFAESLQVASGLPVPDWDALSRWLDTISDESGRASAWAAGELAWFKHLRNALGESYSISEGKEALLLSSLEPNVARATLDFMEKTLQRVARVLDGVAQVPEWGKDLLIVFDDDETYYRYVSRYYADAGEFAASGGMHINAGCSHFATMKSDLRAIEPVIVHEMTHGCLGHLPIPA